jgi:hypothetical protein
VPLFRRRGGDAYPPDPPDPESPSDLAETDVPPSVADAADAGLEADDAALPPSRMRGTEPLYGYVVALELLVVAILNVVLRTGPGAPAHPQTTLQLLGIIASVGLFALIRVRNRTIVGLGAIVAAFFVTLPKVPNSLTLPHILALVVPLAYGLIVTQRQRRAIGNTARSGRRAPGGARPAAARSSRGRQDTRRRAAKAPAVASGPRRSARYTPPKAKRGGRTAPKR